MEQRLRLLGIVVGLETASCDEGGRWSSEVEEGMVL